MINAVHYYMKHIVFIWQAVLRIWNIQNQHLHPTNHLQDDCTQLQAAVNQIIHEA